MATQGTDNLPITGIPSVKELWNGRFRLEFTCNPKDKNEGWYSDNIAGWLPAFGTLQEAGFVTDPSWEMTDGTDWIYPDMHLVEAELRFIPAISDNLVVLAYETLTASYVEEKGEDIDHELSGLKRVVRTFVALPEAPFTKVVGTDTIEVDGTTLFLGSAKIEKTDAKWELTETWLEAGELSREENFEDGKGSLTITQIGGCPATPAGFTPVNESKNNVLGFETCTITFYEDNSILSRSNDYVGSQLAEVIEVFNPTSEPTPTNGGVLGSQAVSNVDGIPTTRYTFLVPSILSQSEDNVGSQLAIVIETFSLTPSTPAGYDLAKTNVSDVAGIPTRRYTFLKPSVLSQSTDNVGSQKAITIEAFSETPSTPAGYELAREDVSDFEGIPTNRFTFLKPAVLSRSEDKVGSQLSIVIDAFNEVPATPAGYSLAKTDVSDVEGIPTNRYIFLKPSILSQTEDLVGSQLAIIIEAFSEIPDTPTDYTLAKTDTSDIEGIPTRRYTFLKPSTLTDSTETKFNGALLIRVKEEFNQVPTTPAGFTLTSEQTSNVDGIPTRRYSFAKGAGQISTSTSSAGAGLPRLNRVTIRSFGTAVASTGFLIDSDDIQRDGYVEFVRTTLDGVVDTFSHDTTVTFTMPGTVTTDVIALGGGFNNLTIVTTPPVPTPCDATVTTTYTTDSTIDSTLIYRPTQWASSTVSGIGFGLRPISSVNTHINHIRIGNGDSITGSLTGAFQCCMGTNVFGGVEAEIDLDGPTEDPAGTVITLSISKDEAFVTADGTQYYKGVVVTASVPNRP
jgi:hypothetical protein